MNAFNFNLDVRIIIAIMLIITSVDVSKMLIKDFKAIKQPGVF
jgi:hypothetical protein